MATIKKPKLKKIPALPKLPKKPKAGASAAQLKKWLDNCAAKKKEHDKKVSEVKKENAAKEAAYKKALKDRENEAKQKQSLRAKVNSVKGLGDIGRTSGKSRR